MIIQALSGTRTQARRLVAATMLAAIFTAGSAAAAQAAPLAQFNRETFAYSSSLAIAQEANRYQTIVLQATDYAQVPALKAANPNLKILMYSDVMLSRSGDTAAWTTCTAYTTDSANHPDWFLLDQNGNRVADRSYPGDYVMDVGNPGYQQACAAHASALATQYGFDGVYFDDVTSWVGWALPAGVTAPQYPTAAAWQSAMYSWITYTAAQLHAQNLLMVSNIGGSANTPGLWQQWTAPMDGSEEESWTDAGLNYYWAAELANAEWSEANGKLTILHTHSTTAPTNTYGLASMMLIAGGTTSYSTSNANYTSSEAWYPQYDTAQALGAPTGAYTKLASGVYERTFVNGLVLVNPSGATTPVNLGGSGTFSGSGLTSVTGASMGPQSGLVLLADSTAPGATPVLTPAPVNATAPTVSGTLLTGRTLTANAGGWSANPAPTYAYQWSRCTSSTATACTPIPGATARTYTVLAADGGSYLGVTVIGANPAGTAQASSANTAQVPTATFTLTAAKTSFTVKHGGGAYYGITVTPKSGFTGAVALSVTGLPAGAKATFSRPSTTNGSTLNISTTSASIGTSTVTVSGTGGGQTSVATVKLIVT